VRGKTFGVLTRRPRERIEGGIGDNV